MPAEKQNNISEKLDTLQQLPEGYKFSSDAVWNRLEPKLKKAAINYRAVFFAAASFLAVIIFIAIPSKRNDTTGKVNSKSEQILPAKMIVENPVVVTAENKKPGSESVNHKSTLPVEKIYPAKKPVQDVVITQDNIPDLQKEKQEPAPEIKTETQTAVVVVKSKRRFPIAHINELNSVVPVEEEPVTRSKTSFAFRKQTYETVPSPVVGFEDGFTERKKPKSIFPLLNSSQ
jgi:hypothetical protein